MVKNQKKNMKRTVKTNDINLKNRKQKAGKKFTLKNPSKKDVAYRQISSQELEEAYNRKILSELDQQDRISQLLPIKVKGKGLVSRSISRNTQSDVDREVPTFINNPFKNAQNEENNTCNEHPKKQEIVTITDILLKRDEEVQAQQVFIGTTCAAILENPEARIENIGVLLNLIENINREGTINFLVVRKTAMISLVEVFKDIVPEYRIGIIDKEQQKLKKDTLARVNFESKLLTYYKQFLKQMEMITNSYSQKMRRSEKLSIETRQLLETAVQCMCDLVLAHPYFNYSPNIIQLLVLMLNNPKDTVRKAVHSCFSSLFKTDTRLDLTNHTVRHINMLIKKKQRKVFPEMISCLKSLQIHRINMNDDTLLELKKQKLEKQKSYVINMSRTERKRKKKLQELEKDIFETKAEESKHAVRRKLTEISKLTFMIYFKVLKCFPDSKVLSATLEGLSKFAHTINIDFFADLIELLNNLLENAELGYREQLHCIETVFTILSGQGEVLNIDPARFYSHFYKNLLYVNAGKNHDDMETILKTLDIILFKRRRNVTYHRYVGFVKRLATLCLHVLPNGSLGLIALIRSSMHMQQQLDILLDTEANVGSGKFDPFNEEPEFCHANCTALFESSCLMRHYHPTVRKMTANVLKGANTLSINAGRNLSSSEYYVEYDCSEMVFNPEIPPPAKTNYSKARKSFLGLDIVTRDYVKSTDFANISNLQENPKALMYDCFFEYIRHHQKSPSSCN
ncbi:nucleolar complex protein 3 homolog [Anopheles nili]|uniref:nucleolar complex protein 3 homolog n=1 Tax=Anopheles nili TaxID=185578 RepID=UPI00237B9547|nr:nucleolar complex protein 3 homolog [Anopheles nili]